MTTAEAVPVAPTTTVDRAARKPADGGLGLTVIRQAHPVSSPRLLASALERAAAGDCVAYAVAIDTPIVTRLMTLATFRLQRRRAERAIVRAGA